MGERPEEAQGHCMMGKKMKFPTIATPQAPELVGDANRSSRGDLL